MFWQRRLKFKGNKKELTLGVELELQVLDEDSLLLTPQALEIIERVADDRFKKEFFQSTLEIASGVCDDVHGVRGDLQEALLKVLPVARGLRVRLGSTGTHPLADNHDRLMTPDPRYELLAERNQWMITRRTIYGMHVHLGMKSGQRCIQYGYFFMHFLPHLLALAASSPFWRGENTGLASSRLTAYESSPTSAMPYFVRGWRQFQRLFTRMLRAKAIESTNDLWWDVRPSPQNGTLELRFCDEPATLKETIAIVAFVHLLAHWYRAHRFEWNDRHTPTKRWIVRENKWRAMRYGLDADLIVNHKGKTSKLREEIRKWITTLRSYTSRLRYESYIATVEDVLARGNSASRQVQVFETTRSLEDVVRHNVKEFEMLEPIWQPHAVTV